MQLTQKRKVALIAFLALDALIVLALVMLLQIRGERQSATEMREIGVTVFPESRPISDFRLLDQEGEFFTKSDFQGHWNLVFFGFTNCPDICPLTMAELAQFYENLDFDRLEKPRIILVSVDPLRDNPETMAAYVAKYNPDFVGLSGAPGQIAQLAGELYVTYEEFNESMSSSSHEHGDAQDEADTDHQENLITHSGHIAVIDPQGGYHAVFRAPHRDRDLATAYRELVR